MQKTTHEIIRSKPKLPVYFDIYRSCNYIVPSHWHNHVEILLVLEGSMHLICREESYMLHKGDLFLVNSGDIHYTRSVGDCLALLLQVPFEFLNLLLPGFGAVRFQEYFSGDAHQTDSHFTAMVRHLLCMKDLYENEKDGYPFLFGSHLH